MRRITWVLMAIGFVGVLWGIVQGVDILTGLPYDGTTITLPDDVSVTGELKPAGGIGGTKSLLVVPFVCVDDTGDGGATVEDKVIASHPCLTFNEESATQDSSEVMYAITIPQHATTLTAIHLGYRGESNASASCKAMLILYKNYATVDTLTAVAPTAANTWYTEQAGNEILTLPLTGFSAGDYLTLTARVWSKSSSETYVESHAVLEGEW